jgi:peroxiredoxin Q/BCP
VKGYVSSRGQSVARAIVLATLAACACKPKTATPGTTSSKPGPAPLPVAPAPKPTKPLQVGDSVWDFSALAQTGQRVRLHEFSNKPVLIYFCPNSFVEPCLGLALELTRQWLDINPHVSMVFGVTPEDAIVQREFGIEHELPYLLLSDRKSELSSSFGLGVGSFVSYLVDKDGKVLHVFNPPAAGAHSAEVVRVLTELKLLSPAPPL